MKSRFCQNCGYATQTQIPLGDSLERQVCPQCGTVHYINPKIICGALVLWQDQVLLCRRAIEPRYGLWTLPAGFMELNETVEQGAMRETREEAQAHIHVEQLYCMYNLPNIGQVYVLFKSQLIDGQFGAGEETIESRLFREHEIPWDQLAFPSVRQTLQHYFHDRKQQHFPLHLETLTTDIEPAS